MHYFIDGYNLLFYLFGSSAKDLKSQREKLIAELNLKAELLALNVTVVFDSHLSSGEGSRSHFHHLEIIYTPEGINADDLIIKLLHRSKDITKEIVVTNDRDLAFRAKTTLASSQSLDHFLNWLDRRYSNKKKQKTKSIIRYKYPAASFPSKISEAPPPLTKVKLSTPPAPPPPPAPKEPAFVEGSLEFYQAHFEQAHQKLLEEEQEAKRERKLRNKAKRKNFRNSNDHFRD